MQEIKAQLDKFESTVRQDLAKLDQLKDLGILNPKAESSFAQLKTVLSWTKAAQPSQKSLENLRELIATNTNLNRKVVSGFRLALDRFDSIFDVSNGKFTWQSSEAALTELRKGARVSEIKSKYSVPSTVLKRSQKIPESAPPGQEEWILKNKRNFQKQYGKDWKQVLYATAWKREKAQESISGVENILSGDDLVSVIFDQMLQIDENAKTVEIKNVNWYGTINENLYAFTFEHESTLYSVLFDKDTFFDLVKKIKLILEETDLAVVDLKNQLKDAAEMSVLSFVILEKKSKQHLPSVLKSSDVDFQCTHFKYLLTEKNLAIFLYMHDIRKHFELWHKLSDESSADLIAVNLENYSDLADVYVNSDGSVDFESLNTVENSLFNQEITDYSRFGFILSKA